jgi:hypothetical protein
MPREYSGATWGQLLRKAASRKKASAKRFSALISNVLAVAIAAEDKAAERRHRLLLRALYTDPRQRRNRLQLPKLKG